MGIKIKILLIEDDEKSAELMKEFLNECGFSVDNVYSITDAISYASTQKYDIALLDMKLPDYTGLEFLKNIQKRTPLPVIVVSAYSDIDTKLQAFKYGASDYVIKPIDMKELEARIWVQLGKQSEIGTNQSLTKDIEIDGRDIYLKGKRVTLTNMEFDILSILLKNKGNTVNRESIIESLSSACSHRSLDNHIKNIRKKLSLIENNKEYIKTVYGVGYILCD